MAVDDQSGERNRKQLRRVVEEFRAALARYVIGVVFFWCGVFADGGVV